MPKASGKSFCWANESYTYDAAGNRQTTTTGTAATDTLQTSTSTTTTGNQLQSDGTFIYSYDADGNVVQKERISEAEAPDFKTVYSYDNAGRLVEATTEDNTDTITQNIVYTYNSLGERVGETVTVGGTSTVTKFAYDLDGNVAATFTGSNVLTGTYVYGQAVDQLLAQEDGSGNVNWMITDRDQSVRDVVQYNGTTSVVDHIDYNSFGVTIRESNSSAAHIDGYAGYVNDLALGMLETQSRIYNPSTGEFTSQDPSGFSGSPNGNLYEYAGNSPVDTVDPSGLSQADPTDSINLGIATPDVFPSFTADPKFLQDVLGDPLPENAFDDDYEPPASIASTAASTTAPTQTLSSAGWQLAQSGAGLLFGAAGSGAVQVASGLSALYNSVSGGASYSVSGPLPAPVSTVQNKTMFSFNGAIGSDGSLSYGLQTVSTGAGGASQTIQFSGANWTNSALALTNWSISNSSTYLSQTPGVGSYSRTVITDSGMSTETGALVPGTVEDDSRLANGSLISGLKPQGTFTNGANTWTLYIVPNYQVRDAQGYAINQDGSTNWFDQSAEGQAAEAAQAAADASARTSRLGLIDGTLGVVQAIGSVVAAPESFGTSLVGFSAGVDNAIAGYSAYFSGVPTQTGRYQLATWATGSTTAGQIANFAPDAIQLASAGKSLLNLADNIAPVGYQAPVVPRFPSIPNTYSDFQGEAQLIMQNAATSRGLTPNAMSAVAPRSLSERIADFQQNPQNWQLAAASAEQATARAAKGGVSVESTYTNTTTGEMLYVHDVYKPSGNQIPNHPTYRDYGKGGN